MKVRLRNSGITSAQASTSAAEWKYATLVLRYSMPVSLNVIVCLSFHGVSVRLLDVQCLSLLSNEINAFQVHLLFSERKHPVIMLA